MGEDKKIINFQNVIMFIGIGGAIISIIMGIVFSEDFPEEKYISAAAFSLLITTAFLQNRDLNLNRKALEKQIEELQFTRDEQKEQTKEFRETNKYNKENLEITQFYEMLTLREELFLNIIRDKTLDIGYRDVAHYYKHEVNQSESNDYNFIEKFNRYVIGEVIIKIKNFSKDTYNIRDLTEVEEQLLKERFENLTSGNKELLDELKIEVPSILNKLYTYNRILDNLVHESSEDKSLLYTNIINEMQKNLRNAFKVKPSMRYKRTDLYEMLLTDEEKLLDKIISNQLNIDDILNYGTQ